MGSTRFCDADGRGRRIASVRLCGGARSLRCRRRIVIVDVSINNRECKICGRLDQNDIPLLLADFGWADELVNRTEVPGLFNVSPGMLRPLIHWAGEGLAVDDLFWGYRSPWAEATGAVPIASNAQFEKLRKGYWKPLLTRGRAIVPAAGWYEWTGEKPNKQPWHIHRADRQPLYIAALASFESSHDFKGATGFALVTAAAGGGMVDIHDRRPLVLTREDARAWLDPHRTADDAAESLHAAALGSDVFAWHRVDQAVGNTRNQGAQLALPC